MAKLHEVLAVEGDLEGQYKRIVDETMRTFNKAELFTGKHKTLQMFDDSRQKEAEAAEEDQQLTTTVRRKLEYTWDAITRYLDCVLQKEETNQQARASVVMEGKTYLSDVPATFLLGLENKLKYIRAMYDQIPTLPPGTKWEKDVSEGDDVYVMAEPEKTNKTEKQILHKILVAATDKHPAQVEKWTQDIPVGIFSTKKWSGMITPREKHIYLQRIDALIKAVKEARQRANTAEVIQTQSMKVLMDFINAPM